MTVETHVRTPDDTDSGQPVTTLPPKPEVRPSVAATPTGPASGAIETRDLNVSYGSFRAVKDVNLPIPPNSVTAIIGPSGCGKSTFLRTLNRMHEVTPGGRVEGKVMLDDQDLYASNVDPVAVRRTVGMVFQRPNPFPTMSIYDNVVAGLRLTGRHSRAELDATVERCLRSSAGLPPPSRSKTSRPTTANSARSRM